LGRDPLDFLLLRRRGVWLWRFVTRFFIGNFLLLFLLFFLSFLDRWGLSTYLVMQTKAG
jgi:hypothetical protein